MSTDTPAGGSSPLSTVLSANDLSAPGLRMAIAAELGHSGFNNRDRYDAFGWEVDPDEEEYAGLYLRNAYGGGIIDKAAQLAWRHDPDVEDTAEGDGETAFEEQVAKLARNLDFWTYATRTHKAAGFGEYALLFVDFDDTNDLDSLDSEVSFEDGSLDNIRGFRVIPQFAVDDVDHGDFGSERWGEPEYYTIDWGEDLDDDLDDTGNASRVHHSRLIEAPSKPPISEEYSSRPRMERWINTLYDIEKLLGSAAEMSYRGADKGLNLNVDPTKVDPSKAFGEDQKQDIQEWLHGLQPTLNTVGTEVNDLGGDIRDPSGALEAELKSLSAATGFSKQFIEGAAAGEIASSETNMRNDFGEIRERQQQYVGPYLVRRGLDVLIDASVLPRPEGGQYDVEWPDLFELSDKEEAEVHQKRSTVAKNLGLMGEPAQAYVESGEFPEDSPAPMQPVDESNPAVANQFERTANDWTPELHPRDGEGKFAETGGAIGGTIDSARDAFANATTEVEIGGESVQGGPVLREAFDSENTPLKQAATGALDDSFVEGSSYGPDKHGAQTEFNAWREERGGSLLNDNTAELWGAAIDDTGNDNLPEDATSEPITYGDPLPATEGGEPTTAIGDSVSVTRDTLRQVFGDTVPVTRGVSGEFAEEIREAAENGEEIELEHRALESWTTLPEHAQQFANEGGGDGVLITTEVPVDRVYGASHTTPGLHEEENEIVAALDSAETYSPEQIYDASDEGLNEAYRKMQDSMEDS